MRAEMDEIKCDKIVPGTSFLLLKCKLTVILTLTVARSIHSLYLLLPPPSPLENYQEVIFADYEKLLDCCGKQKGKWTYKSH